MAEFVARCVASEQEVEEWGALVGRGFSHRPGDPARFLRKYRADPTASWEWTRVVEHTPSGRLVGSVRGFNRRLATGAADAPWANVVGIGEVCSDPDFRGRGVASVMMADAVAFMDSQQAFPVGALHAAEAVRSLYAKYGFRGINFEYGWLRLPAEGGSVPAGSDAGQLLPVELAADWPAMAALYEPFHAQALKAVGWVDRNGPSFGEAYWTRWVPNAIGSTGKAFKLVAREGGAMLAYATVVMKPDGLKLWDFAALPGGCSASDLVAFLAAAAQAVLDDPSCVPCKPAAEGGVKLIIPSIVLRWLADGAALPEREEAALSGCAALLVDDAGVDKGWMFRAYKGEAAPGTTADSEAVTSLFLQCDADRSFLLWHMDSF